MQKHQFDYLKPAGIVIGSIAAAAVVRAVIDVDFDEPILYTTFYVAVMASALYGGWRWGASSIAFSALVAWWLPVGDQTSDRSDFGETAPLFSSPAA